MRGAVQDPGQPGAAGTKVSWGSCDSCVGSGRSYGALLRVVVFLPAGGRGQAVVPRGAVDVGVGVGGAVGGVIILVCQASDGRAGEEAAGDDGEEEEEEGGEGDGDGHRQEGTPQDKEEDELVKVKKEREREEKRNISQLEKKLREK